MRSLTARQRQVLLLVAAGCTGEQIGARLGIASTTVTRHLTEAYRFLGAADRAHAVALAIHHGHITLAELAAIAQESTARGVVGPREAVSGPQGVREASRAARDVGGAPRGSGGRTEARGEAAA